MNAQDIRTLNERMQEQMLKSQTIGEQEAGFKSLLLSLLSELTAQHAEENEHIKRMLNPPLMFDKFDPSEWPDLNQHPQPIMMVNEPRATLRDQFAMAAMTGLLSDPTSSGPKGCATAAYLYADAMMEARK